MSYQEVYNGLNKKASNEQIKKLASIIGMKKRATDNTQQLSTQRPGSITNQYLKNLGVKGGGKDDTHYNDYSKAIGASLNPWPSSSEPGKRFQNFWNFVHNWKTKKFNQTGKLPIIKSIGRPMDLDSITTAPGNDPDVGQFNSAVHTYFNNQDPARGDKAGTDTFWDAMREYLPQQIEMYRKNIEGSIPAQKIQYWKAHPEQIFLDLADNRKPSYSQKLYS